MLKDTRLILIEGVPGTGKSTIAQWIHRQLCSAGRASYWWHEERAAHPLNLFYVPDRHHPGEAYADEAESLWRTFAQEQARRDEIAVLDAPFLQNHVRSMLIFNCDRRVILDLIRRIEILIASLNPVLIYLKPIDLERNFSDVVAVRGQRMMELWIEAHDSYLYSRMSNARGYSGFIDFWEEFVQISDRIFEGLTILKHRLNCSSTDWESRFREIGDRLGLVAAFDSSPSPALDRFVGKYHAQIDDESATEITIRVGEQCLVASVDEPTIDVDHGPLRCFREVRLIPGEKNSFYVAAWPHRVQFVESVTGDVIAVQVNITDDGWIPSRQLYLRQ